MATIGNNLTILWRRKLIRNVLSLLFSRARASPKRREQAGSASGLFTDTSTILIFRRDTAELER